MKQPELLRYDLDEQVVAFSTTRRGGYSSGAYGELNINGYCGDDETHIAQNRDALCRELAISADRLVMPHQTHQTEVCLVDEAFLSLPAAERQHHLEGIDAVLTDVQGVCIGVSTADCIPLLLYDPDHRAVGAVHAGWRGTVARIVSRAVAAMGESYGTRPDRLRVIIGPGISLESFEVGQEVYDAFAAAGFDMPAISRRYDKWHIDLPACNRQQLLALGVPPDHIIMSGICTFQQHDRFFSARRLGIRSGRIFTGIML
ncbi:MAG: peptidoglycan editing factor PgeF [Prevotella sp.]|nr:peptidoglycan editing factor PgeF [Prevotella sp.]